MKATIGSGISRRALRLVVFAILVTFSLPVSAAAAPATFNKTSPVDLAIGQPQVTLLTWSASAGATSYEYCLQVDASNVCHTTWVSTTATSVTVALSLGSKYGWQVRARNVAGVTDADQGIWWRFAASLPAGYYLLDDMEGPSFEWFPGELGWILTDTTAHSGHVSWTDRPSSTNGIYSNYDLASALIDLGGAIRPELRFWTRRNFGTNGTDAGQVLVVNAATGSSTLLARFLQTDTAWTEIRIDLSAFAGTRSIYIDFQTSGSILTRDGWHIDDVSVAEPNLAAPFRKTTPADAKASLRPILAWEAQPAGTVYEYCIDVTPNGSCDGMWTSVGSATSVFPRGLAIGVTYTWQVRARDSHGVFEADAGRWGTFIVVNPPTDFNHDDKPDLVWFHEGTRQLAAWNMGGGSLGERMVGGDFLTAPVLPVGWRVVGAADADGDGNTDLFLQSASGQLGVWFFNGAVLRYGMSLIPGAVSDPLWRVRAVDDFNHDGHPDLVWQYGPTGQVAFWLLNGVTVIGYAIPAIHAPGPDWEIVGTGDSNHDGEVDLFWQHRTQGSLAVWWMRGTEYYAGLSLSVSPSDPQLRVAATCDLNGDGATDLVLQHSPTGTLVGWFLDVQNVKDQQLLYPSSAGDLNWRVVAPR